MMKYARIIFFTALAFSAARSGSAGDEYWGNIRHGSSRTIGNSEFFEDGTSAQHIGTSRFYSDGTTETAVGDVTFSSDGEYSIKIGRQTFRSDGNNGIDIGRYHFYDGRSVYKSDGSKWVNE